jgi:uncharacterized membrane protein
MGRVVSHPHTIQVTARNGRVQLSGLILEREVEELLARVSRVPGALAIENRLEVHQDASTHPALGDGKRPPVRTSGRIASNWPPATRLAAGTTGFALMASCAARRSWSAALWGTIGFGLAVRSITNLRWGQLLGIGCGRDAFHVQKTLTLSAPVDEVFAAFANYENFPRFMSHLEEVRDLGAGRSHWVAVGPGGLRLSWSAELTCVALREALEWRSEPGSAIANRGSIRFQPNAQGGTRVDIHMSYNPPAGALGHFAALLFGADPKSAMDEDLVRLKSLLEHGKASAPGKRATREDLFIQRSPTESVIPESEVSAL